MCELPLSNLFSWIQGTVALALGSGSRLLTLGSGSGSRLRLRLSKMAFSRGQMPRGNHEGPLGAASQDLLRCHIDIVTVGAPAVLPLARGRPST